MPVVRISRTNEYANRLRSVRIMLDGKELGIIGNGETKDFEVSQGVHLLQAKIDWCSSGKLEFTISENEIRSFTMASFANGNVLALLATIYYITFGANKYLNLREA